MPEFCVRMSVFTGVCVRACSNNHSCCVMSAFWLKTISHSNIAYFLCVGIGNRLRTFFFPVNTSNAHLSREQEQKTKQIEKVRETGVGRGVEMDVFVCIQNVRGKKSIKCHPALKFEMSTFNFSIGEGKPIQIIIWLCVCVFVRCIIMEFLCARG